jgi:hypothetical protein
MVDVCYVARIISFMLELMPATCVLHWIALFSLKYRFTWSHEKLLISVSLRLVIT